MDVATAVKNFLEIEITDVPKNVIIIPPGFSTSEIEFQVYQYDRNDYLGWADEFQITFTLDKNESYHQITIPPSVQLADYHTLKIPILPDWVPSLREKQNVKPPRKIPYTIWNVSAGFEKQANGEIRRQVENIRHLMRLLHTPNSEFFVKDDEECRVEMQKANEEIEGFAEAYNALKAGSYKADMMRYWLLFKYGGIYVDDKTLIRSPLDDDTFAFLQADLFIGVHRTPEIAFMGSRPGSPILLNVIKKAIQTIRARDYTKHRLGITGNFLFTEVLNAHVDGAWKGEGIWRKHWGENVALLPINIANDLISFDSKIVWQKNVIPSTDWPRSSGHYSKLWVQKKVFVDGNPEISVCEKVKSKIPFLTILICLTPFVFGYLIKWLQHEVYRRS